MLREAAAGLFDTFDDSDLVSIRYKRGVLNVLLQAIPGESRHDVVGSDGGVRTVRTVDWVIKAAELVLGGSVVLPVRGQDVIEQLNSTGGVVATFAVTHPAGAEPYRYCDHYQTLIRIQTVQR